MSRPGLLPMQKNMAGGISDFCMGQFLIFDKSENQEKPASPIKTCSSTSYFLQVCSADHCIWRYFFGYTLSQFHHLQENK